MGSQVKDEILARIDNIGESGPPKYISQPLPVVTDYVRKAGPFSFIYKEAGWCIPENFMFPQNTTRLIGWRKWLRGSVHVEGGQRWKIKPFRNFISRELHSKTL